jgi:phosphoribosylglycinamide formyltransferase 1
MFNIAVISSGMSRGSNLKAMVNYFRNNNLPVNVSFVIRTIDKAPINTLCLEMIIPGYCIAYKSKEQFEEQILYLAQHYGVHVIILSGFLKKLTPTFIREIGVPILNIHPALLPKYGGKGMYGGAVHKAVFEAREKKSGATVHLVDASYDHGRIIAQSTVDISDCNNPEEIGERVLLVEHELYGKAIWEYLVKLYS